MSNNTNDTLYRYLQKKDPIRLLCFRSELEVCVSIGWSEIWLSAH